MAAPAFPNEYTLRTVAETASKPCFVCHRPTAKVLATTGNKVSNVRTRPLPLSLFLLVLHLGVEEGKFLPDRTGEMANACCVSFRISLARPGLVWLYTNSGSSHLVLSRLVS